MKLKRKLLEYCLPKSILFTAKEEGGIKLSIDSNFAYAIGRIRAIEKRLIDKGKFDRMIDSKTPEEALKTIAEAGYSETSSILDNVREYESILKLEGKRLYALLKDITSDSEVFDIFLLKNDYHNIKVILKSEFLEIEIDDNLLTWGTIPIEQIKALIIDRNFANLSIYMKESIEDSLDIFSITKDPRQVDLILDRAYFKHILDIARKSGFPYISQLIETMIDTTNIKTYLRIKNLNMSLDLLSRALIPGGMLDNSILLDNLDKSLDELLEKTRKTKYSNLMVDGIADYTIKGNFSKLEKLIDDQIIGIVKKTKYNALGIEPLIGYLVAKETEIKNLRIVMVGKINNIPNEIIRERLRETYV